MTDIGKKLMDGESYRAGLPKEVYEFARYIAPVAADDTTPEQLVMLMAVAQDDIATGHYILNRHVAPHYMLRHGREVLERAKLILLLIDEIADRAFSMQVRRDCQAAFGWSIPSLSSSPLS
ncbi:hypothetical protein IJG22_02800 [Candidatus Saccharibacteria bacterium]|nr:hypothetical protein [Candidatus Saccharibacteria bacterium]